jgi:hypothetical protein
MLKLLRRFDNHFASQEAIARALYSASLEDLEALFCLFLFYDMSDLPRKTQNPEVDLLVFRHPPNLNVNNL